jgi:hypothetical protein
MSVLHLVATGRSARERSLIVKPPQADSRPTTGRFLSVFFQKASCFC